MGVEVVLALALLSLAVGVFWGWLVYFLRKAAILPDDGSIVFVPCPWEWGRGGQVFWLHWILLYELKGSIFVLLGASLHTGWPPILLLAFGMILEAMKFGEKVRHLVTVETMPLCPPSPR